MAITTPIKIRGKTIHVSWQRDQPKALLARFLLDEGYTVSEISKAVPMAYSQVHQLAKREVELKRHEIPRERTVRGTVETKAIRSNYGKDWGDLPQTARQKQKATKPQKVKLRPGIGKLRTPGLPSDIGVGVCANCGHDLVVTRGGSTGYLLKHVNITTEEYLAVAQFCNATPKVLLS